MIPGAEPIVLAGRSGRGVLILHGFGDTPQSVITLARALNARGYSVRAPLLPGHGRTLREFAASRADEWVSGARAALRDLASECSGVSIVGQSLGGVLATLLVSERPQVDSVALLAPYFEVPSIVQVLAHLEPALQLALPYITTSDDRSILDPEARARSLSFGATTPRLTVELERISARARAALPGVRMPTLYVQSRHDNRIAPEVAERAFAALGASKKDLVWLKGSGHVIAADFERDRVAALVADWFDAR
jgi:carboxylesterase